MTDFITAVKAHAPRITVGALSGLDFGPIHSLQTVVEMAHRDGFQTEYHDGRVWVLFHDDIEGAFRLYEDDGHVKLDADGAADVTEEA